MGTSSPQEIDLTPDLLEYAKAVAIKEAQKRCPDHVDFDDVIQEVWLKLLSKPPKYDPTKGASVKTLIYTVVQRIVIKYVARECRHASRFKQIKEPKPPSEDEEKEGKLSEPCAGTVSARAKMVGLMDAEAADAIVPRDGPASRRPVDYRGSELTTDDVLEFVDSEESREICRMVIDCDGNMSEAARRLGVSEGKVRYRLKMLAPKLLAASFQPFKN